MARPTTCWRRIASATAAAWGILGALGAASASDRSEVRVQRYEVAEGTLELRFDGDVLASLGFSFAAQGAIAGDEGRTIAVFEVDVGAATIIEIRDGVFERFSGAPLTTCGALLVDRPGERIVIGNLAMAANAGGVLGLESTLKPRIDEARAFDFGSLVVELDRRARRMGMLGELSLSEPWAAQLGIPEAAGTIIGSVAIDVSVVVHRSDKIGDVGITSTTSNEVEVTDSVDSAPGACGTKDANVLAATREGGAAEGDPVQGSDVLVADLQSVIRYPPTGDITSFAIATLACNIGTERANWIRYTNQHPVILQNLFRLKDSKFEQIGMAWVKHGFYAVSESFCSQCLDLTDGSTLGVGCSDPYSASLNGMQSNMSPRYLVNAHTGYFPYPWGGPAAQGQERRLLVSTSDLNPALNTGARYFMEGHYVHPDDCRVNTQDNNASYREVLVEPPAPTEPPDYFKLKLVQNWVTQRGQAAVRAWQDVDPGVFETEIRVPGEGLFILAAKATPTGTGLWRYSYALQNLNSDRSARTFALQLPSGAILSNVGFHDIAYHSGEPIQHTPWQTAITSDSITWSTGTYDMSPYANALRYASVYSFYFDANIEPGVNKATLGLFKPGAPMEVAATTRGPKLDIIDCNRNEIKDACDLDCGAVGCVPPCGESIDCNQNAVPDECEQDCNGNSVADECDIRDCPPGVLACGDCNGNVVPDGCEADCDGDEIPDACDPPDDSDGDGITDCFDLCPLTTPVGSCAPPEIVGCRYQTGFCIPDYPRWACIGQGGTPICSASVPGSCDGPPCPEALCRFGCLLGDYTRDGVIELLDFAAFQRCFGGSVEEGGFVEPSEECLLLLDFDEDDDIDAMDYVGFEGVFKGP